MRLSEIMGERVLEVIADLIDPIANIAEDDDASALFRREKLPQGMTAKKFLLEKARKAAPSLLKGHKGDLIQILSTLEGVSMEEYADSLSIPKLLSDFVDLMTDDGFTTLFTSAQSEKPSGSAQENTEAP